MAKIFSGPVMLAILDGWGIGDDSNPDNAIAQAKIDNYKRILHTYPNSVLETSGLAVGLPEGQMGNSEVGHMTIGAGRTIFQDLPRIDLAIENDELAKNPLIKELIHDLHVSGGSAHIMGLLSDGGVHSHQNHLIYLAKILAKNDIEVYIHAFLDGRDVAQKSALNYIANLKHQCAEYKNIILATISGRYYAMDRDKKWDRIKLAYDAIVEGVSSSLISDNAFDAIENSYEQNITDEFIKPTALGNYGGISDGDAMISINFRADRIRQISESLLDKNFSHFKTRQIEFSLALAMTEYSDHLNNFYKILFPPQIIKNSLPEILSNLNLRQLRIAETEKYAHVTFFFSAGLEKELKGESRILIKSPSVATYDLQPEMSAKEIGENLQKVLSEDKFDFIIVNYANPDMVGHSGLLEPAIKACETIDEQLALLEKIILQKDGILLISADHGNIECMKDHDHQPHTAHTTNKVPFIIIGNKVKDLKLSDGSLSDIAPTILDLMQIEKPQEMTGISLIRSYK